MSSMQWIREMKERVVQYTHNNIKDERKKYK